MEDIVKCPLIYCADIQTQTGFKVTTEMFWNTITWVFGITSLQLLEINIYGIHWLSWCHFISISLVQSILPLAEMALNVPCIKKNNSICCYFSFLRMLRMHFFGWLMLWVIPPTRAAVHACAHWDRKEVKWRKRNWGQKLPSHKLCTWADLTTSNKPITTNQCQTWG